jgi:hypothetical protein
MSADSWYAWFAIGAAASLGGMIWAFRRGVLGVLANLAAGIGGGLLGGALAHGVYPEYGPAVTANPAPSHPSSLFFAGLGAIIALLILHMAWAGLLVWRGRQAPAR